MMTRNCWGRIIRAPWLNSIAAAAVLLAPASAQSVEALARVSRERPTAQTRAALQRYAAAHPSDANGGLALLALGSAEIDAKQYLQAVQHLKAAGNRLPVLADYSGYLRATAQFEQHDYAAADDALAPVWQNSPPSPLAPKAVALQANLYLQQGNAKKAVSLLEEKGSELPPEKAELLLGKAYAASGDSNAAAVHFQKLYTEYPLSAEAEEAAAALKNLPAPGAQARLVRCWRLIDGREYNKAKRELEALIPQLGGADLDTARVRLGAVNYYLKDTAAALHYLRSLEVAAPEAGAERLFYLAQCARRLDQGGDLQRALDQLAKTYPNSPWRLQALVAAGDYYGVKNQPSDSTAAYRSCYESFPADPKAAYCHWKVAWSEYLKDRAGARELLAEHVKQYPGSDHTAAALYFLGRIAEAANDNSSARVYYQKIAAEFPNQYYELLARERLKNTAIANATPSDAASSFLAGISFAPRSAARNMLANAATKARIDRARLLANAGLYDYADGELRYGARKDGQPQLMAVELAQLANRQNAPDRAIRMIKHYAPDYLSLPIDPSTATLWKLAFPLPFRKSLEVCSEQRGLDPFLMAALIRQESEFNPNVVSIANAYGLTQILPSTGREISRKLNIRRFRAKMLFTPDVNLRIGAFYLKSIVDSLHGDWEASLASYNAGKSRVLNWLNWNKFQEPAEFVESIPLAETRNYVKNILRNADVYRRLYAPGGLVAVASTDNGNSSGKDARAAGSGRKPAAAVPQQAHGKLHRVRNS